MACDVATLINGVAANGLFGLEDRGTLLAMAGYLSDATGLNASQAMEGAKVFYALQDRQIDEALLALCGT